MRPGTNWRAARSACRVQVSEVLLPLCSSPSIKSVLIEHKAALLLAKAVSVLVKPLPELQQLLANEAAAAGAGRAPVAGPGLRRVDAEGQSLAGLLLQLVGVLMDPDISMNPWADRWVSSCSLVVLQSTGRGR